MFKKTRILVISVTLAALLALTIGGVAMAAGQQEEAETNTVSSSYGRGSGLGGLGICSENVTALLGLTDTEIQDMRQQGLSLVDIAASQNVTEAQLLETVMAERQLRVQEMVAAGAITQERAALMLQNMEQNVIKAINRTAGPPDWAGQGTGKQGKGNGNGRIKNQAQAAYNNCSGDPAACTNTGNMNQRGRGSR